MKFPKILFNLVRWLLRNWVSGTVDNCGVGDKIKIVFVIAAALSD
jgi:hypothetical protein